MSYGIIYQFTNKVNGKIYIGKTIYPLNTRKGQHLYEARSCRRPSYFHKALRKYGIKNFKWEILCECDDKLLLGIRETMKIIVTHSHVSEGGYNLTWGNDDNPMNNPEVRIRHRISLKRVMKKFSGSNNIMKDPVVKERHQKSIDILVNTDEWKRKVKECNNNQKSEYEITTPSGETKIILGLGEFCRVNDLQQSKMSLVALGNRAHHKGYKCKLLKHNKNGGFKKRIGTKIYHIITPAGDILDITNLPLFCEEHSLKYVSMLAAFKGKQKQHKGYSFLY